MRVGLDEDSHGMFVCLGHCLCTTVFQGVCFHMISFFLENGNENFILCFQFPLFDAADCSFVKFVSTFHSRL